MLTRDELCALAREGNRDRALRYAETHDPSMRNTLRQIPVEGVGFYFPALGPTPENDLTCRVDVSAGDARPPIADPLAQAAITDALRDAWLAVGGLGAPPACAVEIPLCPVVNALGLRLAGSSLYLATMLAAASHFTDTPRSRNVLATGHFAHPLGDASRKVALARNRGDIFGRGAFLVAGTYAFDLGDGQHVHAPESAIRAALRHLPWARSAAVRRVFVQVPNPPWHTRPGPRNPPTCWGTGTYETVSSPAPISTRADYDALGHALTNALSDAPRVELVLGVPQIAAAFLGDLFKNGRWQIVLVHQVDGRVLWRRDTVLPPPGDTVTSLPRETRRVLFSCKSRPSGWTPIALGASIEPMQYAQALANASAQLRDVGAIELSTDGPVAFAWAMGETFSTRRGWSWMQYDQANDRYVHGYGPVPAVLHEQEVGLTQPLEPVDEQG